jgi:hypothetical protein
MVKEEPTTMTMDLPSTLLESTTPLPLPPPLLPPLELMKIVSPFMPKGARTITMAKCLHCLLAI